MAGRGSKSAIESTGKSRPKPDPRDRLPNEYELVRELGRGAYGRATLCRKVRPDGKKSRKLTVVKTFARENDWEDELRAYLETGELCPDVLPCLEAHGPSWLAITYYPGMSDLATSLKRPAEWADDFDSYRALDLLRSLARNVSALHRIGYAHRDVKPANLLTRLPEAETRLLDLGFACRMPCEGKFGTANYISPEYARAKKPVLPVVASGNDAYAVAMCVLDVLACASAHLDGRKVASFRSQMGADLFASARRKLGFPATEGGFEAEEEFEKAIFAILPNDGEDQDSAALALGHLLFRLVTCVADDPVEGEYFDGQMTDDLRAEYRTRLLERIAKVQNFRNSTLLDSIGNGPSPWFFPIVAFGEERPKIHSFGDTSGSSSGHLQTTSPSKKARVGSSKRSSTKSGSNRRSGQVSKARDKLDSRRGSREKSSSTPKRTPSKTRKRAHRSTPI